MIIADWLFWGMLVALVVFLLDLPPLAALLQHWYSQLMTTCTEVEKPSLHHGSDEFVRNNLPYVHGLFVGRDSELREISATLLFGSVAYADVAVSLVHQVLVSLHSPFRLAMYWQGKGIV